MHSHSRTNFWIILALMMAGACSPLPPLRGTVAAPQGEGVARGTAQRGVRVAPSSTGAADESGAATEVSATMRPTPPPLPEGRGAIESPSAGSSSRPATETPVPDRIATEDAQATAYFFTPTPRGTLEPGLRQVALSNRVPLEDVIQEMTLGLGGGGGNEPCYFTVDAADTVAFMSSDRCRLMEPATFSLDWEPAAGQAGQITVTLPGGKQATGAIEPAEYGGMLAQYQPPVDAPAGKYTFELRMGAHRVTQSVTYASAAAPLLYLLTADPFHPVRDTAAPPYQLLLYGFKPNEAVRLIGYQVIREGATQARWVLAGYQDLTVGADGRLVVQSNAGNMVYIARGQQTGEAHMPYDLIGLSDIVAGQELSCPGALRPRLSRYVLARVAFTDGKPLRVRAAPGGAVLVSLPEGSTFNVADGPRCAGGSFWWQISTEALTDGAGWVAESAGGVYLVEPGE